MNTHSVIAVDFIVENNSIIEEKIKFFLNEFCHENKCGFNIINQRPATVVEVNDYGYIDTGYFDMY